MNNQIKEDIKLFNKYELMDYSLLLAIEQNLENQSIILPSKEKISFQVDTFRKHCLINGLDDIGLTMQHSESIKAFEKTYYQKNSWLL